MLSLNLDWERQAQFLSHSPVTLKNYEFFEEIQMILPQEPPDTSMMALQTSPHPELPYPSGLLARLSG